MTTHWKKQKKGLSFGFVASILAGTASFMAFDAHFCKAAAQSSNLLRGPLEVDDQIAPSPRPTNLQRRTNPTQQLGTGRQATSLPVRQNTRTQNGTSPSSMPDTTGTTPLRSTATRTQAQDLRINDPYTRGRRLRMEEDPYAALGIRAGGITYFPSIEIAGGYTTNSAQISSSGGAGLLQASPALRWQSDWTRHSFTGDIRTSYSRYLDTNQDGRPTLDGSMLGTMDVQRDLKINLGSQMAIRSESISSADLPAAAAERPNVYTYGVYGGLQKTFNRVEINWRINTDRTDYDSVKLSDGSTFSNDDRSMMAYGTRLRTSYEIHPGMKPYLEGDLDQRVHDDRRDRNGYARDSYGWGLKAGTTYEITRLLTLDGNIGYASRQFDDSRLQNLHGITTDISLIWTPTALTTVRLRGSTNLEETTLAGVQGRIARTISADVTHALRRNISLNMLMAYTRSDYQGLSRDDNFLSGRLRLDYKVDRMWSLFGSLNHERSTSSIAGQDYKASTFLMGVRAQR